MNRQLEHSYQRKVEKALEKAEEEARRHAATPARFEFLFVQVELQTDEGKVSLYGAPLAWACTCPRDTVLSTCSHAMTLDLLLETFLPQSVEEMQS